MIEFVTRKILEKTKYVIEHIDDDTHLQALLKEEHLDRT